MRNGVISKEEGAQASSGKEQIMWREYIERLKEEFIGKSVEWCGKTFEIVDVDYNGIIHINRASKFNATTAVYMPYEARQHMRES